MSVFATLVEHLADLLHPLLGASAAAGAIVLHRHVRLLPALREEAKARLDA